MRPERRGQSRKVAVEIRSENRSSVDGNVQWCRFAGTVPIAKGEHRPIYKAGISFLRIHTPDPTLIWTKLKIASNLLSGAASSNA